MGLLYVLLLSSSFFFNTFPVPLPSAQQVPLPETRLPLSLTLQSSLIHSYPIPCPSSPAVLFTLLRHEMKQQQQQQRQMPSPQPFSSSGSTKYQHT